MWNEIFKDIKPRKSPSKAPQETCHFDKWERPSDRFAKMDEEREETPLTDWPTTSTMKPSPTTHDDKSSDDDEQAEEDPSEASQDDPNEYDKYWDSDSEPEDLEAYQSTTMDITPIGEVVVKKPEDEKQPTDNKSQEEVLNPETLVTPRKVPRFRLPPGYETSSTGPSKSGFADSPSSSQPTPSKDHKPESTTLQSGFASTTAPRFRLPPGYETSSTGPYKSGFADTPSSSQARPSKDPQPEIIPLPEVTGPRPIPRTSATALLKHFARNGMSEFPEMGYELRPDKTEVYQSITSSQEPSEHAPRKRDNSWSEHSGDASFFEPMKELQSFAKQGADTPMSRARDNSWSEDSEDEKSAELADPEKIPEPEPSKGAEPSKPLPTQLWYAEIEDSMKALVLQASSGDSKKPSARFKENSGEKVPEDEEKESESEEETGDPEHLARLVETELQDNVFSPFYSTKAHDKKSRKKEEKLPRPSTYKHSQAIRFAAKSHLWKDVWDKDLPNLPVTPHRIVNLPQKEPPVDKVFAFYRVLAERNGKYVLIACSVNVHGFHRGDLRFLEVNFKTKLKGFEESVMGNLFLGDILAVTRLARCSDSKFSNNIFQVSAVSQDSKCYWMVSRAILYPRSIAHSLTFSFVKTRRAVVKGDDEPMTVQVEDWETVSVDSIYSGSAFRPIKLDDTFSHGFMKSCKQQVILKALRIATYPNSFGTIFHYEECPEHNEEFLIGTKAFSASTPDLDTKKREQVVETCSLMGFSAANTIFNGRFDCRAFHMQNIQKMGLNVHFRIDNPPGNPTLGLWTASNRIKFGGPFGDVNAAIETVIEDAGGMLKIVARMSRDCPKNMSFNEGEFFVSQREINEPTMLYDGYFQAMPDNSNGKKIIRTLYGGEPLKVVKDPNDPPVQYFFPSTPDRLPLNQYQNEYVQMLLDNNPLVIGSSPFGCGKSMTIITAALEIYKRNCKQDLLKNQSHQLLITQSNFASVNLIEITKRICATKDPSLDKLKFARYVSEKNWNELSEHCRTDHDMPHLMKEVFKEWAVGNILESDRRLQRLSTLHFKNMMGFLLKNTVLSPEEFSGPAKRVYEKNPEPPKTVQASAIAEAFFILYQPDIIMTTADSSKNMIGLLKEVCTVQIDEASQLPEYTLLGLLKTFSSANFGLIGDIHQLPPYCEETLDGRLKEFGIGNTMERAIEGKLFPISTLRYVYRCHPKTTQLLSELFYDGSLLSGVSEHERDGFMRSRKDFWPNFNFPMMILNHTGASFKMGTSTGNQSEKDLVGALVQNLLRHGLRATDIGVISFYSAQTSILTEHLRASRVKCGTVDAFQGTEKEVIIVCCTNATISGFMQDKNRLNVALSRAKQATIVVGNLERLEKAKYWSTIVTRVEAYGNLRQANDRNLFNSQKPHCSPSTPHRPSGGGGDSGFTMVKNPYFNMMNSNQPSCSSPSPTPGPSSNRQYAMVPNNTYPMGNQQQQQQRVHNARDRFQDPEPHRAPRQGHNSNRPHRGGHHRNHRPSPKPNRPYRQDDGQDDVMRGQWNTTTHSFRRSDGYYQHP